MRHTMTIASCQDGGGRKVPYGLASQLTSLIVNPGVTQLTIKNNRYRHMSDDTAKPKTYREHIAELQSAGVNKVAIALLIAGYEQIGIDLDAPHKLTDEDVLRVAALQLRQLHGVATKED